MIQTSILRPVGQAVHFDDMVQAALHDAQWFGVIMYKNRQAL